MQQTFTQGLRCAQSLVLCFTVSAPPQRSLTPALELAETEHRAHETVRALRLCGFYPCRAVYQVVYNARSRLTRQHPPFHRVPVRKKGSDRNRSNACARSAPSKSSRRSITRLALRFHYPLDTSAADVSVAMR